MKVLLWRSPEDALQYTVRLARLKVLCITLPALSTLQEKSFITTSANISRVERAEAVRSVVQKNGAKPKRGKGKKEKSLRPRRGSTGYKVKGAKVRQPSRGLAHTILPIKIECEKTNTVNKVLESRRHGKVIGRRRYDESVCPLNFVG